MARNVLIGFIFCLSLILAILFFPQLINAPFAEPTPRVTTFLAVGDIMLGRHVELLSEKNPEYPFEKIAELLSSVDFVVGNFEGTIVTPHERTPYSSFTFSFPLQAASVLKKYNFDLVTLANNHGYDFGGEGYESTKRFLEAADIKHFGNPYVISAEQSVWRETRNTIPLVWVGINATFPNFNSGKATDLIHSLRTNHSSDFLIVQIHWGNEYSLVASSEQEMIAHALIDAGADMIIGHHPHVVQNIELYKDRLIFYSLGNFIFDQYFSKDVEQGLALRITLTQAATTSRPIYSVGLIPLQSHQSQPRPMTEQEKGMWLADLAERSSLSLQGMVTRGEISLMKN